VHTPSGFYYPMTSQHGTLIHAGDFLGKVGTWANGNHLHFGIWVGTGDIPIATGQGLGMNSMSHWPGRLGWVDPVRFIESECPPNGMVCYGTDKLRWAAFNDMKMSMIGKFRPDLTPQPNDLRYVGEEPNFYLYCNWFYIVEPGGHTHWYEAHQSTHKTDPNTRWIIYFDDDTSSWSPWYQVIAIP
jgi:hypothetical protein